jgi:uncharacterized protein YfaS (alpha-2-macroglobulin family)
MRFCLILLAALVARASAGLEKDLMVVSEGPEGALSKIEDAREIRIRFSEPMVALGGIPEKLEAPYVTIAPPLAGSFRFSGTRTLIFTPATDGVPYATAYTVTIGTGAVSSSGHRLKEPVTFHFTTPTVRLESVDWIRADERFDRPARLRLHFNEPVRPAAIAAEVSLSYAPHEEEPHDLPPAIRDAMAKSGPGALHDFEAKVERARASARASGVLAFRDLPAEPNEPSLVELETLEVPPPGSWLKLKLSGELRSPSGKEVSGEPQEQTVKLEPVFFVSGLECLATCNPEDWNPLAFTRPVLPKTLRGALAVSDLTKGAALAGSKPVDSENESGEKRVSLEDAGFSLPPGHLFSIRIDRSLVAADGQTLGYTFETPLELYYSLAFTSLGTGNGVWEASGGPSIPFSARNMRAVRKWLVPVAGEDLVKTVGELEHRRNAPAPEGGLLETLHPVPDEIQAYGLDGRAFLKNGTGLLLATLENTDVMDRSHRAGKAVSRETTLLQVTNLGVSVKDSPLGTLVFVTRLDTGEPVEGALVTIRDTGNRVLWKGTTAADGLALSSPLELRDPEKFWDFRLCFVVTAEKDGDLAYLASDWNQGIEPWVFNVRFDLHEAKPLLRGVVFSDRGVYRLGEEVHLKLVLRSDSASGIALLPPGTRASMVLEDSHGAEVARTEVPLSEWSSAEWVVSLPKEAPLGTYVARASLDARSVTGTFLVAAYRRPDFRVDASLVGEDALAGTTLHGLLTGRYLFGAPMSGMALSWSFTRSALDVPPPLVLEHFPSERYCFLDAEREEKEASVLSQEGTLDPKGESPLELKTDKNAGAPYLYTLEGSVTDVSRQSLSGRKSFRVEGTPFYIALKRPPFFADARSGLDAEISAVDLQGSPLPGIKVHAALVKRQWHSVKRVEGRGGVSWETKEEEVPSGDFDLTTEKEPSHLHVPVPEGGSFVLLLTAGDAEGRSTTTAARFYALGEGYTAWKRYDHNRIDLVPEKKTYHPGETARIMVQSPWEHATALLTVEREGIRSSRTFTLNSTQETVKVPIKAEDAPNVFVSVLLVKGRSGAYSGDDPSDPGKPSYRLGYTELTVEDAARRLEVGVATDADEYRPGQKARVSVRLKDQSGAGGPAEVTLWAVDYGVLSLTGYETPDLLPAILQEKALAVMNEESRENLISRRVLVPKGGSPGGGGGEDEGPASDVRRDFRVLAFWLGSVVTDASGAASTAIDLPESLTTYRIMAVAADKSSRFGFGEKEVRTSKPVLVLPAFPRFLVPGDAGSFGAVVHSNLKTKGTASVEITSLDPQIVSVQGSGERKVDVGPEAPVEVPFALHAVAQGNARLRVRVTLEGEQDAFMETLPVRIPIPREVVAAYGETQDQAKETIALPQGALVRSLGVELSSTALVSLGEGARYLVDYPYGCAEQRSSAALALLLTADLGEAFSLSGIDPPKLKGITSDTLAELPAFQCDDGGFAYWKGTCAVGSPYLSAYVLHVLETAKGLGYPVSAEASKRGYAFLQKALSSGEGGSPLDPATGSWKAYAVKILAEGGENVDSSLTRLYDQREGLPVFALTYLLDALFAKGEAGARPEDVKRRILNAILPEGGLSHVEEMQDPDLLWLWNSNVRTTALALKSLVKEKADRDLLASIVRWLLAARQNGRWGSTQENATALEALVAYYRAFESEVPDFAASVRLSEQTLVEHPFKGRSAEAQATSLGGESLSKAVGKEKTLPLVFSKTGVGTLHYAARLTYEALSPTLAPSEKGIAIERSYGPERKGEAQGPFKAGQLVRVSLKLHLTKERRFVALVDPLPAGFEPVESWFATSARDLAAPPEDSEDNGKGEDEEAFWEFWQKGGFDHVERHDDRVLAFATRLSEGDHVFTYVVRATTPGTFLAGAASASEMYEPEVFGRTASAKVVVTR